MQLVSDRPKLQKLQRQYTPWLSLEAGIAQTQKLYEICSGECKNTYYIQTLADLDSDSFQSIQCVGITAGASTPNKIIEEVSKHVRIKF